jgi:anti-sigma-K factor RskA
MMDMGRERFENLMEAYALDALSNEERAEVETYLEANPEAQAEVEELQSVVGLLALSPEDRQPPPELRKRLMRAVEAEAGPVRATLRGGHSQSDGSSILSRVKGFFSIRNTSWALAGALLIGLFSWNALLRSELREVQDPGSGEMQTMRLSGSGMPEGSSAEVVAFPGREAVLVAEDLPELEAGEALQIWVIDEDVPQPAGVFEPEDGMVTVPVTRSLEGAEAIAITVEPEGGSEQPTSEPVMTAEV